MEKVIIDGTSKTPSISLDPDNGKVMISGRSIPENAVDFYQPVYKWLDMYADCTCDNTEINVKLEYFNTSSSKCILQILKKLENLQRSNKSQVKINWFYEEDDEDMQEAGEDFDIIIEIPFEHISIPEIGN